MGSKGDLLVKKLSMKQKMRQLKIMKKRMIKRKKRSYEKRL